jgi:hypothetical protein
LLEDVLADPIVHSVMRHDRVDPKAFSNLIAAARRHLRSGKVVRASGGRFSPETLRRKLRRLLSRRAGVLPLIGGFVILILLVSLMVS